VKYKQEIILSIPLRNSKVNNLKDDTNKNETEVKERLTRFYRLTEKLRETEWNQEYFLIYNSYTLDNA